MFLVISSKENTDLCIGTRVGYQIMLELLLKMCPGPFPIGGLNLKTKPKRKGKT